MGGNIIKTHPTKRYYIMDIKPTIYGIGIADRGPVKGSLIANCPVYEMWRGMLRRCYGKNKDQSRKPRVCSEWLFFSNFADFVESSNSANRGLRLKKGHVYCEDGCYFVDKKPFSRVKKETSTQPVKRNNCTCSCTCGAADLLK
jgi:hypothetical protein